MVPPLNEYLNPILVRFQREKGDSELPNQDTSWIYKPDTRIEINGLKKQMFYRKQL